jgi:hypothetical protein
MSNVFKSKFLNTKIVDGVIRAFVNFDGQEQEVGIVDPRTWSASKCRMKVEAYLTSRDIVTKSMLSHDDIASYFVFAHRAKHDIKTMRACVRVMCANIAKSNERANKRAQRAIVARVANASTHNVDVNDVDATRIVETFDAIANNAS